MKFGYNRSSVGLKEVQEFQVVGCAMTLLDVHILEEKSASVVCIQS